MRGEREPERPPARGAAEVGGADASAAQAGAEEAAVRVGAAPTDDPRRRPVQAVLGAVAVAAGLHVALGSSPWARGAAARIDLAHEVRPDDAMAFVWCGSLLLAAVAGGLALSAGRWLGPRCVREDPGLAPPPRPGLGFALGLAGAILVCAALAAPRLDLGMWDDEIYSARHSMVGRYRMRDGEPHFVPVGWRETFWHYRMPNNHVPYSIAARVAAQGWLALRHPTERLRIEVPLRLPALALGLATLALAALLGWRLGFPGAGLLAAWLLALHPWHVRYASEARGYALVLLLVLALAWALVAVLRRGRWDRWLAFGAGQLLLLWTYPAALPLAACANLVLTACLLHRLRGGARRAQLLRQAVVGLAGGALFLELMLPNLIQLAAYTGHKQLGAMDVAWWRDVGAYLAAGMPWQLAHAHPFAPELRSRVAAAPGLAAALAATAVLAIGFGAVRLLRRHGDVGAGLAASFVLPAPLVVGLAALRGSYLHPWYLVFALPGLAMLLAIGLDGALAAFARRAPPAAARTARVGACVGVLAAFAALTAPVHAVMRAHPFSAQRRAVLATRPNLDPADPANARILTASIVDPPEYYDPRCVALREPDDLRALMRRADAEARPLFVNTGRIGLAAHRSPELAALVEDPALFEPVAELHGLVPRLTRQVYRYRAGAYTGASGRPRSGAAR